MDQMDSVAYRAYLPKGVDCPMRLLNTTLSLLSRLAQKGPQYNKPSNRKANHRRSCRW
jgi:hypothetical protein